MKYKGMISASRVVTMKISILNDHRLSPPGICALQQNVLSTFTYEIRNGKVILKSLSRTKAKVILMKLKNVVMNNETCGFQIIVVSEFPLYLPQNADITGFYSRIPIIL
ncbi:hypothetical protein AB6A40_007077 [Gnathostoma spinigerum]|uniref:Uncharacterized protein n=1 Tax=Gnathostoma spinigerum TaxID=75299 RepID=A0ABD6ETJ7_9BILA